LGHHDSEADQELHLISTDSKQRRQEMAAPSFVALKFKSKANLQGVKIPKKAFTTLKPWRDICLLSPEYF